MRSAVSSITPFGAMPMPCQTGSRAWHIEQREVTICSTSSGAFGSVAATAGSTSAERPSLSRPAGEAPPLQVLHDWLAVVLALGAVPVEPPRQEPFGAEAWLADPAGNRLLLLVSGG